MKLKVIFRFTDFPTKLFQTSIVLEANGRCNAPLSGLVLLLIGMLSERTQKLYNSFQLYLLL